MTIYRINKKNLLVNGKKSKLSDEKKLFVKFININKFLSNQEKELLIKDKYSIKRLIDLSVHRSVIKKAIMTIPYNASSVQLIKYLQEQFDVVLNTDNNKESIDEEYELDISSLLRTMMI